MSIRSFIMGCWQAQQRRADVYILWPSITKNAPNSTKARAAFALHAFNDPAWLALGKEELLRQIDALPWKDET